MKIILKVLLLLAFVMTSDFADEIDDLKKNMKAFIKERAPYGFHELQSALYLNAIIIIMGFLVLGTVVRLLGNLISDLCYAVIDPRIRFK